MKNCRESRIFPRNMKLPDGWTDVLFSSERSVIISFSPSLEPRIERERERKNNSLSLWTRPTIKTLSRAFSRGGYGGFSLAGLIDPRNPESLESLSPPLVELPFVLSLFYIYIRAVPFRKAGGQKFTSRSRNPSIVTSSPSFPERKKGKHSFSHGTPKKAGGRKKVLAKKGTRRWREKQEDEEEERKKGSNLLFHHTNRDNRNRYIYIYKMHHTREIKRFKRESGKI